LPSRPRFKMIVWSSAFRMTVRSFFCFGNSTSFKGRLLAGLLRS
jgi:hypothetical protein